MNVKLQYPDVPPQLAEELLALLGAEQFLAPDAIEQKYHSDWSFEQQQCPAALLLPESTEQVSAILALCHNANQPVVIQGGLTGLAGGATPRSDELAISLERITGIEFIDKNALTMTVKAGTTLASIHNSLIGTGLNYGVDYGARDLCQIGGNVATNAGGTQVIHFGMTRAQVLGLEVVLADGTIIDSMNHLLKNNAGYDLKQLFIGTEGTLGVVTKLVLRLFPETSSHCAGLFAIKDVPNTIILLNLCRSIFGASLQGFEVMWDNFYCTVSEALGEAPLPHKSAHKIYALVEIKGRDKERDSLIFGDLFEQCLEQDVLLDGAIAEDESDIEQLWNVRYAVKSLLKSDDPFANFDIGIPIDQIDRFTKQAEEMLTQLFPNIDLLFFGHLGDGNLHLIAKTENEEQVEEIYRQIYPLCAELGGTIAAEHGIGVHKKTNLALCRTKEEIALMKLLKRSLDPKNILNPGRVFDL